MSSSLQDDPIVRSMDVYVQRDVNLHLLQFPLRPAHLDHAPVGAMNVEEARIKPKAGLLEVVAAGVQLDDLVEVVRVHRDALGAHAVEHEPQRLHVALVRARHQQAERAAMSDHDACA